MSEINDDVVLMLGHLDFRMCRSGEDWAKLIRSKSELTPEERESIAMLLEKAEWSQDIRVKFSLYTQGEMKKANRDHNRAINKNLALNELGKRLGGPKFNMRICQEVAENFGLQPRSLRNYWFEQDDSIKRSYPTE